MEEVKSLIEQQQAQLLDKLISAGINAEKSQGAITVKYQASIWVEVCFSLYMCKNGFFESVKVCICRDRDKQQIEIGIYKPTLIDEIKYFLNAQA